MKVVGTCIVLSSSIEHGVHVEYLQIVEPQHSPDSEGYFGDDEARKSGEKEECPEIRALREQLTTIELKFKD